MFDIACEWGLTKAAGAFLSCDRLLNLFELAITVSVKYLNCLTVVR